MNRRSSYNLRSRSSTSNSSTSSTVSSAPVRDTNSPSVNSRPVGIIRPMAAPRPPTPRPVQVPRENFDAGEIRFRLLRPTSRAEADYLSHLQGMYRSAQLDFRRRYEEYGELINEAYEHEDRAAQLQLYCPICFLDLRNPRLNCVALRWDIYAA